MEIQTLEQKVQERQPITALIYCPPGVGKSTALGIIAEHTEGLTMVLDVYRTFATSMAKREVVHDLSRIDIIQIDNVHTFDDWT
ncbi:MAG: hypothetical protein IKU45_02485, partial [Clostridia bacterium]|nr:hypothetical protein [Clostridia bacterium]